MKINFHSKYLDYDYIINNDLDIYSFYFFKNNELLYIKKWSMTIIILIFIEYRSQY